MATTREKVPPAKARRPHARAVHKSTKSRSGAKKSQRLKSAKKSISRNK